MKVGQRRKRLLFPAGRRIAILLFGIIFCLQADAADKRIGGRALPQYRQQYALIIGINYDSLPAASQIEVPRLRTAEQDALSVQKVLTEHYGYQSENVHLLLGEQASLKAIRSQFGTAFLGDTNLVQENDSVLIFYAGHGVRQQRLGAPGDYVGMLYPSDLNVIAGKGVDPVSCLRIDEMLRMLQDYCAARHKLVILDSCHSGEVFNFKSTRSAGVNRGFRDTLFNASSLQAIAAAQATQVAADADESGEHSPFTRVFLDALEHGPSGDRQKLFTASELFAYIPGKISQFSNVQQDPRGGWLEGEGDFYFFPKNLTNVATVSSPEIHSIAAISPAVSKTLNANSNRDSIWPWFLCTTAIVLSSAIGTWAWTHRLSILVNSPIGYVRHEESGESNSPETSTTLPALTPFNEQPVKRPTSEDRTPNLRKSQAILLAGIFLFGVLGNLLLIRVDRSAFLHAWTQECLEGFASPQSESWLKSPSGFVERANAWLITDNQSNHEDIDSLVESLPLEIVERNQLSFEDWQNANPQQILRSGGNHLAIEVANQPLLLQLNVRYHMRSQPGETAFQFTRQLDLFRLYGTNILVFLTCCVIAVCVNIIQVVSYRSKRRLEYKEYESKRTKWYYAIRDHLKLAEHEKARGELDSSKNRVKSVLAVSPGLPDAVSLRNQLDTVGDDKPEVSKTFSELYLQVTGSPYAYHAPYGSTDVTIGRQRRKSGQSPGEGNDFVIRIPGSEKKTRLLSRRHLEIDRVGHEFFVIDRSKVGTLLNGRRLPRDQPTPIVSSDRLIVSGVLTLEVVIRRELDGEMMTKVPKLSAASEVELSPWNNTGVVVEASLGDFVTLDED